jgi:ribonuclease/clavin/mitogillin
VNAYLVSRGHEALLVDAGKDSEDHRNAIIDTWHHLGEPRIAGVLLTHGHSDHSGGVEQLADALSAPIFVHPEDLALLHRHSPSVAPEVLLADRASLRLGVIPMSYVRTPGHTRGHVCFHLTEEGTLFTGDIVPGVASTLIAAPNGSMGEYLQSLRTLLEIRFSIVAPGHGAMVEQGWRRTLEVLEVRLRREGEIIALLRLADRSEDEIVDIFYGDRAPASTRAMGLTMVESHLLHLESESRVTKVDGRWSLKHRTKS